MKKENITLLEAGLAWPQCIVSDHGGIRKATVG
jgi:hypothetical protein